MKLPNENRPKNSQMHLTRRRACAAARCALNATPQPPEDDRWWCKHVCACVRIHMCGPGVKLRDACANIADVCVCLRMRFVSAGHKEHARIAWRNIVMLPTRSTQQVVSTRYVWMWVCVCVCMHSRWAINNRAITGRACCTRESKSATNCFEAWPHIITWCTQKSFTPARVRSLKSSFVNHHMCPSQMMCWWQWYAHLSFVQSSREVV